MEYKSMEQQEVQPKDAFFAVIKERVDKLLQENKIPKEYAVGVLERAGYVEGPFDSVEDATEKGKSFLEAIEPIAEFGNQLNLAEEKLNAYSEVINQAEGLVEKMDLADEKRLRY